MLGRDESSWDGIGMVSLKAGSALGTPVILFEKLDEGFESGLSSGETAPAPAPAEPEKPAETPRIPFSEFQRTELRVGRILSAEPVPKSDKLLKLSVDIGEPEPRQIVAGLKPWYAPEAITGRLVVVVANLEPARIRGVESNGMVLASDGESGVFVIEPGPSARPGDKVR
jgi:methionyl-tRNA synthetase